MTALGHCLVALGLATQPPAGSLIPSTDIYLSTFYVPGPPLGAEILQVTNETETLPRGNYILVKQYLGSTMCQALF